MPTLRIATIDTGVNPNHPHVRPIAGGVRITETGQEDEFLDLLGHGTAVAGAIRERAPNAEIFAVKVFDRSLITSGTMLLKAIDWCLDHHMHYINMSLGTLNEKYRAGFEKRVRQAAAQNSVLVGAFEMNGVPALPGSLEGVVGVVLDETCPRSEFRQHDRSGRTVFAASGYPRPIPGVPPARNLQGISFSVANVTGLLAAQHRP